MSLTATQPTQPEIIFLLTLISSLSYTIHLQHPTLLALIASATAAQSLTPDTSKPDLLTRRANSDFTVVPHNSIKYIPEKYCGVVEGNAIRGYEPYFYIASGSQSYPAVSATGQAGGELDNTCSSSRGCNDPSEGQTYVRGAWYKGQMRDGNRLQVEYFSNLPYNQELLFKSNPGEHMDMTEYDTVDEAVRKA